MELGIKNWKSLENAEVGLSKFMVESNVFFSIWQAFTLCLAICIMKVSLCCVHTYLGLKEDKQTEDLLKIHWSNAWEEQDPGQKHIDLLFQTRVLYALELQSAINAIIVIVLYGFSLVLLSTLTNSGRIFLAHLGQI